MDVKMPQDSVREAQSSEIVDSSLTRKTFAKIKSRGILCEGVDKLEDYIKRYREGTEDALAFIETVRFKDILDVRTLCHIHKLLFQDIYVQSGTFRTVQVHTRGAIPPHYKRIGEELHLQECQTKAVLKSRDDDLRFFLAAAFAHIRIKSIQPFIDGNKRTSRMVASMLLQKAIGGQPVWGSAEDNFREYYEALFFGHKTGDLTSMVNILLRSYSKPPIEEKISSPFRMRCFLIGDGVYEPGMSLQDLYLLSQEH